MGGAGVGQWAGEVGELMLTVYSERDNLLLSLGSAFIYAHLFIAVSLKAAPS